MSSNRFRSPAIDSLKALAILGVVVIHIPATGRFESSAWNVVLIVQGAFEWCVMAFFFVSGLVSFPHPGAMPELQGSFIKKRFKRLLVPYFCFSWLYKSAMIGLSYGGRIGTAKYTIPADLEQWASFVLMPAAPQMYFLLILFGVQLIGLGCWRCSSVKWLPVLISVLFIVPFLSPLQLSPLQPLHGFRFNVLPLYMGSYLLGYFTGGRSVRTSVWVMAVLTVLMSFIGFCSGFGLGVLNLVLPGWLYFGLCLPIAGWLTGPLSWLGKKSGSIYVWHAPLITSAVTLIVVKLFGNGIFSIALTFFLVVIVSLCIGNIVNRIRWLWPLHF
jgi:peptidoglycan/LPS O-acetylase OafA/YrhL